MRMYPSYIPGHKEKGSPYDVLTLHREFDNKCIVRLRGFDNLVFWKEINLAPRFYFKSPRQKILEAQDKAQRKAEQLEWRDMKAKHEFELSGGGS